MDPSLWKVFYGDFHFSFSFSTIFILIFEDLMKVCILWSITVDGKDFVGVTLEDSC